MTFRRSLQVALAWWCVAAVARGAAEDGRALHERLLVLDTHLDTPALFSRPGWSIMERHRWEDDRSQVDYPRMVEGGLDGGFWVIYVPQGPRTDAGRAAARDRALRRAVEIREMVAAHAAHFELAFTAADAERIAAKGKRIVFQSLENAYPLGQDLTLLRTFFDLGVRMASPVHLGNNDLGDSASDPAGPEWRGLSPLGRDFVAECNRLGIVPDASHAADSVFDQMLELSRTPIILSHSGPSAVYRHPRNIDDDRIRRLAAKGGVIQINALGAYLIPMPPNPERNAALRELYVKYGMPVPRGLAADGAAKGGGAGSAGRKSATKEAGPDPERQAAFARERAEIERRFPGVEATFEDFMRHVLHTLKLVGPKHVGFGADWDGGGGVVGMRDVAALPRITERLLREGCTEADLADMWGGNVLRLLRAAEAHAAAAGRR
jgi:membrane dipeptidase